ncbi:pyridoxal phosphate-dependent enzyme [Moniliophthora roreri]|nr:pyridoxal phosphate-dependent enzyme [Moniliophthora roreri]
MTTLLPGISFPSLSAASTIAFAIRSLTEPPEDIYSTLPTERVDRPYCFAIRSKRIRGVFPTASRALLSI